MPPYELFRAFTQFLTKSQLSYFSVREWIQCMQICCNSRTTHSASPPVHSSTHGHTHPPPPAVPMATSSSYHHYHQHHSTVHLPSPAATQTAVAAATAPSAVLAAQGGLPTANPTTFSYHLSPSTLAYLPLTSDLTTQAHPSTAVAVDTGYVSGEPSPTEHAQMVSKLNIFMYVLCI